MGSGVLSLTQGPLRRGGDAGFGAVAGDARRSGGGGGSGGGALSGASLWGFGAALALEHGELRPRLVDLDPEWDPESDPEANLAVLTLAEELLWPDGETRVVWRSGERRVARLVRSARRPEVPEDGGWRWAPDAGGALDRLRVEAVGEVRPGEGEVRVAVEASGVNFLDVMLGMGLVEAFPLLGGEVCGRVVALGPEVEELSLGDRVLGFAAGAFGPEVVTRAELLARAPSGFSAAALATVPVAYVTAELAFRFAELSPGDRVLVHAATGGVGQAAVRLARAAGYEVYGTASAPKQEALRALGVTGVFDSRDPGFADGVLEATGGAGVDLVLNSLTGEGFIEAGLRCLGDGGRFVELGKRGIWSAAEIGAVRPDARYRVLAVDRLLREDPARAGALLRELVERLGDGGLEPLPFTRRPLVEADAALESMREARHLGKVVLAPSALAGGRLRADRSYLVTGGLGGIGLEVADWLAASGAGSVVLSGRRAPDAEAERAVAALRARGAEVRVEICDVTDGEALEALLARVDRELPPLGGVIHSVGVLSDGAVENLDWGRFEEVLWPKALGAWRLHRATLDRELDLFVLFSSVAGVFGNAGQTNHAAANAFLDQLARHRRALGLPGQAVAWGAWSSVGEAEEQRERIAGRLESLGEGWIAPERGIRALDRLVREDAGTSVVVAADWSALPWGGAWLSELTSGEAERPAAARVDLGERLLGRSLAEREAELIGFVREELVSVLRLRTAPPAEAGFFELGMDSLMAVELRNRLNRALAGQVTVSNTAVFDHPDAARLGRHLALEMEGEEGIAAPSAEPRRVAPALRSRSADRVAIVGMACRFPGGEDLGGFRDLLRAGGFAVTRGRPDGLFVDAETEAARPYGAYLDGLDRFDAEFFRIAPVEAELLDPQQRLLLEVSWAALEDAGVAPGSLRGSRTGVYGGVCGSEYHGLAAASGKDVDPSRSLYRATGVTASTAVGRVAFALGLEGPAITVDTACSSSLVAVHQAAAALLQGEADLALAGGVNAILTEEPTRLFTDAGMLAPDGRCKTFDAAADGYVRGEGCGMVALKRLADAERDGDRVLGVVLGSAVNQDGASAGLTVPNGPAQERVIGEALERAGVEPSEVDYLEAHGTGTELGDPVEVEAAAAVYGEGRDPAHPLLLGSVKTNVGHLEGAAGVAGLIKAVLAMEDGLIPPHLHFERPNPRIGWNRLPVRVTSEATVWPPLERPPRAAVSSFGYSGTNAHLILEGYGDERPEEERRPVSRWGPSDRPSSPGGGRPPEADETPCAPRTHRLLPLSGRTAGALKELADRYREWLTEESPPADLLADMAWTAGTGRSHFAYRAGLVFRDSETLRERLESLAAGEAREAAGDAKVAFLYPGEESAWPGMGRQLYEREPVAREVLDRCEAVFREERGEPLLPVLFGDEEGLDRTEWTQPALYALGSALTALWENVGVRPEAVLGHGAGEIAAAQAAGAFDLEGGLRFASRRGALMGSLPPGGAMGAVFTAAAWVAESLPEPVALAAENGSHCVVSGPEEVVAAALAGFEEAGVRVERLPARHAFHSALMAPVLEEIEAAVGEVSAPSVPLVGGMNGRVLEAAPDGAYWRRQAREPVRFESGVRTLSELGIGVLVAVGPDGVLGGLGSNAWPEAERPAVVPSLGADGDGDFAAAVGAAYEAGVEVSFAGLFAGEGRRRASLPTYPFQRERYWVEAPKRHRPTAGHPLLGVRRDSRDGEVSFETELYAGDPGWLTDHRVYGEVVAPGALVASQGIEAVRETGGGPGVLLEDVRIHRPLVLAGEGGRSVQVLLKPDGRFEMTSRAGEDGAWELHAEGRGGSAAWEGEALDVEPLRARLALADPGEVYGRLASRGIAYGPAFRGLKGLSGGPSEALGEVVLTSAEGLTAHPAFLDSCFQVLAGVSELAAGDGVWLPFGWDRLWLSGALPLRVVCHVRLREGGGETRKADLGLYGMDGAALGGVTGFTLRRADRTALLGSGVDELLYEVAWREAPAALAEPAPEPGLFVLSGGGELAEALSRELGDRGQTVVSGPDSGGREDWRSFFGSLPEGGAAAWGCAPGGGSGGRSGAGLGGDGGGGGVGRERRAVAGAGDDGRGGASGFGAVVRDAGRAGGAGRDHGIAVGGAAVGFRGGVGSGARGVGRAAGGPRSGAGAWGCAVGFGVGGGVAGCGR